MEILDESKAETEDLVQLARLAIAEQHDDVRLFVARLVRKYRGKNPEFADRLEQFLRTRRTARLSTPLRESFSSPSTPDQPMPVDGESGLSFLKCFDEKKQHLHPLFADDLAISFSQLIRERQQIERLASLGLQPTKSAIFIGPPGVGKTLTARWLAAQLGVPLFMLDLTTVMSSLLGKTGSNVKAALDYAKKTPCVLLLDEIDAIAKRRSDDSDVGELKRLVTVMLQEVDDWPATGLLIAATNHPELIDPALWRRFDLVIKFGMPGPALIKNAIQRFAGSAEPLFERWQDVLTFAFHDSSFNDIERTIQRFRRSLALGSSRIDELIEDFISTRSLSLNKEEQKAFAIVLTEKTQLSQRKISELTGISRDTIRRYGTPVGQKATKRGNR